MSFVVYVPPPNLSSSGCAFASVCCLSFWTFSRSLCGHALWHSRFWRRDSRIAAVKLVSADHVGLGSDFDGADMPYGMDDVSKLPEITNALLAKGYSPDDVRKILGGNTLKLMQQVEDTAKKLGGKS